jgi:hypothetical protein
LSQKEVLPTPQNVGILSAKLTSDQVSPRIDKKANGISVFTIHLAMSGPEEYTGGAFYMTEKTQNHKTRYLKPNMYDAIVFLGGRYTHGRTQITGGRREMFSIDFWPYPDLPINQTINTASSIDMEEYIRKCNMEQKPPYEEPCSAEFLGTTATLNTNKEKSNAPLYFVDPNSGKKYDLAKDYLPDETDFFVPRSLEPGEMVALRWKSTGLQVNGEEGESFVIGLPPELLQEFEIFMANNGLMDVARKILYEEEPLEYGEHRLYQLKDGQNWAAMVQGSWDTDMVWYEKHCD